MEVLSYIEERLFLLVVLWFHYNFEYVTSIH